MSTNGSITSLLCVFSPLSHKRKLRNTAAMKKVHLRRIPSFLRLSKKKQGDAPGSLTHVGEQKVGSVSLSLWSYNETACDQSSPESPSDARQQMQNDRVHWLNIVGLHNIELVRSIGEEFGLHSLLLEDVLNTGQRPKIEEYDDCLFVVVKMLHDNPEIAGDVRIEQLSMVLKDNLLITFQEQPNDDFTVIRDRIKTCKGRLRLAGADYLCYRLLDTITDGYFAALQQYGDDIENIEDRTLTATDDSFISSVYVLRRQMLFLRKAVAPMRDVVGQLEKAESDMIDNDNIPFFRDVYDHAVQAIDAVDTYRDLLSTMLDNHLSIVSHKTNTVMKVLTVMASIFIPLTFIVGVYGMNFRYMPELQWTWGYPAVWGVMASLTIGMLLFFRKKGWL